MTADGGLLGVTEVEAIKSTWAIVQTDLKGHGVKFFIHFFTGFPEYQKVFRGFSEVPLTDLSSNKRLIAHGYTVMTAISGLVDNLDDPEVLTELLLTTGRNHIKRKLKKGDFQNLRESLLEFFGKALGEKWTTTAAEAWKKVLGFIVDKIGEGLTETQT